MWPETVRKEDLRFDFIRGSGAGGQNRNKVCTAVRITHLPTGITAYSEEERTQRRNRSIAWKRLSSNLAAEMVRIATAGFSSKTISRVIRTYNERRGVTDASGRHYSYTETLYSNGIDKIISDRISDD